MLTANPSDLTNPSPRPAQAEAISGPPGACSGPLAPKGGDSPARPSASAAPQREQPQRGRCRNCGVRGFFGTVCPECGADSAEAT
jgi:hypothetical protein